MWSPSLGLVTPLVSRNRGRKEWLRVCKLCSQAPWAGGWGWGVALGPPKGGQRHLLRLAGYMVFLSKTDVYEIAGKLLVESCLRLPAPPEETPVRVSNVLTSFPSWPLRPV